MANNKVKFLRGTSGEYTVAEKDSDTIYFTTDDGKLYIGDKEVSGSDIIIDDTLSDTSTNPVQNKVVKQAIDNKADKSLYGDTTINVGRKAGTDVGEYSTAEGYNTTANGKYSHSEGEVTTASGEGSHAEGISTKATGRDSHAEGAGSVASGSDSHAGGNSSIASGLVSFSHGIQTLAQSVAEVAFGKYNVSGGRLFSIGDGTADDARHNAFEITTNGGKLHDKDIATTDLIPTSLPANGGNADTLNGMSAETIRSMSKNVDSGTSVSSPLADGTYCGVWSDAPSSLSDTQGTLIVSNYNTNGAPSPWSHRIFYSPHYNMIWHGFTANNIWYGWKEIYTSGNKPYVTGSAPVAANSNVCVSNHGFIPSAIIWWDGDASGVSASFDDTQFTINRIISIDRTIGYVIFK